MTRYALAACAALSLALGMWVLALKADVAGLKTQAAEQRAAAEQAARNYEVTLAKKEREHAGAQQKQEDAYVEERVSLARQRDDERGAAVRLRDKLTAATRNRPTSDTDPAGRQCDGDQLEELGRLAGEGVEVVAEGRAILRERDSQVTRLLAQIRLDRGACSVAGEVDPASTEPFVFSE